MGTTYSPRILDHVAHDPALHDDPAGTAAVAWLLDFAALGLSRRFREAIGARVAEFTWDGTGTAWRWLAEDEAAPILAGMFADDTWDDGWLLDESDLFLPNCATTADRVDAPGSPFDRWFCQPLDEAVAGFERRYAEEEHEDPELTDRMREQLQFCLRHDLVLLIS